MCRVLPRKNISCGMGWANNGVLQSAVQRLTGVHVSMVQRYTVHLKPNLQLWMFLCCAASWLFTGKSEGQWLSSA